MNVSGRSSAVLIFLGLVFCALTAAFLIDLWGHPPPLAPIPLVSPEFTNTATARRSYADLVRAKEDLSDFDCYGCHERNKPPTLRFDDQHNLVVPKEHADVVMHHGTHNRNNLCFNCHDENNLERVQTRDGRELKLSDSTQLCGSCHGPTYRDWDAGAHGRTSGYWNRQLGPITRQDCVSCHNPHSPKGFSRKPAPGPHPLRPGPKVDEHAALSLSDFRRGAKETRQTPGSPQNAGAHTVPSSGPFVLRLLAFAA